MRRLLGIVLLGACGNGGGSQMDAPLNGDGIPIDAPMEGDDSFTIDAPLQPVGTHTFQIDLWDDMTTGPGGNWTIISVDQINQTVSGIKDFASGQTTGMSVTTAMWTVVDNNVSNWTAGTLGWVTAGVAQDTFGGSTTAALPSTLKVNNLDGRYKVEVVVAYYTVATVPTVKAEVNGATTTLTYRNASGKSSANWSPLNDGTTPGDWMIWPDVNPVNGSITIGVLPGRINAVRLSPP